MIQNTSIAGAVIFIMAFGVLRGQEKHMGNSHTLHDEPEYYINETSYIDMVVEKHKDVEPNRHHLEEYARYSLRNRVNFISKGFELPQWKEAEQYVARVIAQLNYGETGDSIKIKFVRDPDMNAFAYEDGTVFLNVGIMASVGSEAELAALLGHEIAHVNLSHNYNSFRARQAYLNETSTAAKIGGLSGFVGRKIALYGYSDNSITQENEADENALNALLNSPYSINGAIKLFTLLKEQEDLLKKRTEPYHQGYFKSHPSTEKRLKNAVSFQEKETCAKKEFLIDSTYFFKLQRRCINESVSLLFAALEFEKCIEFAYKQHLIYPDDNFYLYFICQSLVRLGYDKPELSNKQFITHRYVQQNTHNTLSLPVVYSRFYKNKPLNFVLSQSIFYNHTSILNIKESQITSQAYHPLLAHDTLEFITNEDALEYFLSLAEKRNCQECLFGTDKYVDQEDSTQTKQIIKALSRLNSVNYPGRKNIFIVSQYLNALYTPTFRRRAAPGNLENIYSLIEADSTFGRSYITPKSLCFDERNSLGVYFHKIKSLLPDPDEKSQSKTAIINTKYFECQSVFPELGVLLERSQTDKLNFLSVSEGVMITKYGLMEIYFKIIHCYSLDFRNNTLAKYSKNIGEGNDYEVFKAAIDAFKILNTKKVKKSY